MRQYLMGIPQEVLDAARVDGASDFGIYWRIVMPMAWPVTAAMGILTFRQSWNNLLWPLIVIQSSQLFTLPHRADPVQQPVLHQLRRHAGTVSCISIIPVIILFLIVRRRLLDDHGRRGRRHRLTPGGAAQVTGPRPRVGSGCVSITDVPGIRVGHWTDAAAATGCTVVLAPPGGAVAAGEVRGGAPGTREMDLLQPGRLVSAPTPSASAAAPPSASPRRTA